MNVANLLAPPPSPDRLVVVALSGGVDSAVAAGLLARAGHRVVGMTMRLYDARGTVGTSGGRCCGPRDIEDARGVCEHLGIPHYVIDLEVEFTKTVVEDFVETYLQGETPNPCVKCNQHIKFTPLLERAKAIGAGALVTGHYAQIAPGPDGQPALWRGLDPAKDQSYFLFSMPGAQLPDVWFPLGNMTKDDVRRWAAELALPNACKHESQEICFVPDGNYAGFVAAAALRRGKALPKPGVIVDADGHKVGAHDGTHKFTIGQSRGLGNLTVKEKRYVTAMDPASGVVTVGTYDQAVSSTIYVRQFRWLSPSPPHLPDPDAAAAQAPSAELRQTFRAALQVRHRGTPMPVTVTVTGESAVILVHGEPQVAAPGQAAVLYDGDRVIGGGWVTKPPATTAIDPIAQLDRAAVS